MVLASKRRTRNFSQSHIKKDLGKRATKNYVHSMHVCEDQRQVEVVLSEIPGTFSLSFLLTLSSFLVVTSKNSYTNPKWGLGDFSELGRIRKKWGNTYPISN